MKSSDLKIQKNPRTSLSRVLIVEDNLEQRQSLEELFESQGYEVYAVDSGDKAIQMVEHLKMDKLDLVILDVKLPVMDGFKVMQKIDYAFIPIVFMVTGYDDVMLGECYDAGASVVFKKPIDPHTLLAASRRHIENANFDEKKSTNEVVASYTSRVPKLSPREDEVLKLIMSGYPSEQIASILRISPETVAVHRKSIRRKYEGKTFIEISQIYQLNRGILRR